MDSEKNYEQLQLKLTKLFSSPFRTLSDPMLRELDLLIKNLCDVNAQTIIKPAFRMVCMFCTERLPFFCMRDPDFLPLTYCSCLQIVHKRCLRERCLEISENSLDERISRIACFNCQRPIPLNFIKIAFGEIEYNRVKTTFQSKIKLAKQKEEETNMRLIMQIQEEEKNEQREREEKKKFNCPICMEDLSVNKECITLDCNHKFCRKCLEQEFLVKIKENKIMDILCPSCKAEIDHFVIQGVLPKNVFNDYEKKLLSFSANFAKKDEVIIKCQNASCQNIVIVSNKFDVTHYKCDVCGVFFCVRGCPRPHPERTCEQQRHHEENLKNDGLFEQTRKLNGWSVCPHCGATVEKTQGCNHMKCNCKNEFCYACGVQWHNCKH